MEAPKAPTGVGSEEGVSPSPVGVGSGEGAAQPPPQKNFGMFSFEMVHFDAFWSTFRPTIIATTMFINKDHENHSLRNEDYLNTKTCQNMY